MITLETCGSRLRSPWLLPRYSTGTGWANTGRRGVAADHRATRSDGCAALIVGFTFEQWPGVRRGRAQRPAPPLPWRPRHRHPEVSGAHADVAGGARGVPHVPPRTAGRDHGARA